MPNPSSPAELFEGAIDTRLRGLFVAYPAKVQAVDMARQTVDVIPQTRRVLPAEDPDDQAPTYEALPVVPAVPLVFPRGAKAFLSIPVAVGDFVLVVVCDQSIGAWREAGDAVAPDDYKAHGLAGSMAIPGVFPTEGKLANASGSNITIGFDDGVRVEITPSRMEVGGSGDAAALASRVDDLEASYLTHTHATAGTGSPSPPTLVDPVPPLGYASDVLKVGS